MQKSKTNKALIIISWALVIVAMVTIFAFSNKSATESSNESGLILMWIKSTFGANSVTDYIVRKSAHFLEYTGLSYLISLALYATYKKRMLIYSILFTSAYAATDEFHQLFIDGRSCQISDWLLDSVGAVFGAMIFLLITMLLININKKRKHSLDS